MFHYFLVPLADKYSGLNVFRYLTFRGGAAVVTALVISFIIGPMLIRWLKMNQGKGQPIRTDGPQRHIIEKQGTPTMGGLMILISVTIATLLWADLTNGYVWVVLMVTLGVRRARLYRRLSESDQAHVGGRQRQVQAAVPVRCRGRGGHVHRPASGARAVADASGISVLQGPVPPDLGWFYVVFGALS